MFIGREKEKKEIIEQLNKDNCSYLLIYGLRRVGKTKLINECLNNINDHKIIKYTFRDVPEKINIEEFNDYITNSFNEPYLQFKDLRMSLAYLANKAKSEKIVLFLDEYQFLRRDNKGIDSYFQELLNNYEDISNLKIIFCGSYVNIMLKIIDGDSPLYGRFSYILNLLPFDYYESSLFMNNTSNIDKFRYYACFGGLGFTLTNIDYSKTFEQNLTDLFIEPNSLFEREVNTIIYQEINKIPEAKYLLELIASGINKYSDINREFKRIDSNNNISYLLKKLKELDLIEKVSVINEYNTKNDLYFLKDNLIDFYFSILSKTLSERSILSKEEFYEKIKVKLETDYLPRKFEAVAKQFLIKLNKENKITRNFSLIGRLIYHDRVNKKNGEFDIVTKDDTGYIDFECKYIKRKLNNDDYLLEKKQVELLDLNNIRVAFISKNGVDESFPKDIIHYKLDDFYK